MKRIICLLLSIALLSGLACTAVGAEESEQKTYRYVALGDSIAAGFGLENETGNFFADPALFLTEDSITNPVSSAYPALFGDKLAALGEKNGYDVIATNLATSGYLAEDVADTILEDGHEGAMLKLVVSMMKDLEENPMDNYHEIFSRYIPDADLVSVQLGGNDIIFSFLESVGQAQNDNPILNAVCASVLMSLMGMDVKTSMATGMMMIEAKRDQITYKTVIEAAQTIKSLVDDLDEIIEEAAQGVGSVYDAVKTVNENADFAIINMYNPYGNSLELNGKTQNIRTIVCDIMTSSAEYISGLDDTADKDTVVAGLKEIVKGKLAYPLQYLLAGKTMDKAIKKLNSSLKAVAESKGAIYVDVYNISNEDNFDPHPTAQGHEEIAGVLYDATYRTAAAKMGIEVENEICGDADGDGKVSIFDVTCIQKMLVKISGKDGSSFSGGIVTAFEKKILDVDGDGEVTIRDATAIQRYLAGYNNLRNIGKS